MDRPTLELFCRQLAHWADSAIASGRSPFRRAETFFPLLTAAGEISPPLLLWINRDSCMAGGIFLFPPRGAEESAAEGRACADALGLRHFVSWAAQEIVIWEVCGEAAVRRRTLPVPAAGAEAALFCDAFRALLDELKPLSIVGAVAPTELSPFYVANLCRLTMHAVTPFLAEAFRVAQAEDPHREGVPASAAQQQAYLLLLRMLSLLIEDRLPPVIEPEGFDRALRFAIDGLPQSLRQALEVAPWEIPLPPAAAVRLQHLNRRLLQLRFAGDRARDRQSVDILLQHAAGELGGTPLPAAPEDAAPALLLYPDRCYPAAAVAAEIAPPPLLAFTALLRHLHGDRPVVQAVHPLALGEPPPTRILGTLPASAPPGAQERRLLAARLRISWPNRRFGLPADAPRWAYEFIHLLGLAGDGCRLAIDLPDAWLTAPWGDTIHALLREQFALIRLERRPQGVRLALEKRSETEAAAVLVGAAGERRVAWAELREEALSWLPLTLDLPDPFWDLVRDRSLEVPAEWPAAQADGISLFSRSSLGRLLWQVVGGGRPLPSRSLVVSLLQRHACPLPKNEILQALQRLSVDQGGEPTRTALDRELARWLGSAVVASAEANAGGRRASRHPQATTEAAVEQIRRIVFADGVPRFPEQYLYDHYRPELVEYRFSGPLALGDEFLGRQNLRDRAGMTLAVDGAETAQALLLASFAGSDAVRLPADRHLTAQILEKYLQSLRTLRRTLLRESHRLLPDHRFAAAVAEKIWESLPLPPWSLVGD